MLRFFRRSSPVSSVPASRRAPCLRTLLNVSQLETRINPDGGMGGMGGGGGELPLNISLSVEYLQQKQVRLYGEVTDNSPGNLTVTFSGAATGSTVTDSAGAYSVTLQASQLGNVTAGVTDADSNSDTDTATLSSNVPVLENLSYYGAGNVFYVSGEVNDESPSGLEVKVVSGTQFPSWIGSSCYADGDGDWSIRLERGAGDPTDGWVFFQVTDWWGQASDTDSVRIL